MPRYHFDVETNEKLVPDTEGSEHADLKDVRNAAVAALPMIAAEDLPDGDPYRAAIVVSDEYGNEVFKAKMTVTEHWLNGATQNGDMLVRET